MSCKKEATKKGFKQKTRLCCGGQKGCKMEDRNMRNKVKKDNEFEYEEEVKEFTGLIFHCPKCDEIFHLHIATVKPTKIKK